MHKSLRVTSTQPNTAALTHFVSSQIKSSWLKPLEKERFHIKIFFQTQGEYTNLLSLLVTELSPIMFARRQDLYFTREQQKLAVPFQAHAS